MKKHIWQVDIFYAKILVFEFFSVVLVLAIKETEKTVFGR